MNVEAPAHADARCAVRSRAAREPLAGTALAGLRYLVMVPFRGTWAPKPLRSPGLPASLVAGLEALPAHARPLLVKEVRPSAARGPRPRHAPGRPVLWVADLVTGTLRRHAAPSWKDLADRDLLAADGAASPHEPAGPLVLVCAHGRRDRCCAVDGVPLALALDALGVQVWECSHLGGHRFAATALTLPDGYQYGRLTARDAPGLARAMERRALYRLDRLRGRVSLDRPAQAAEILARRRWELRALGGVRVEEGPSVDEGQRRFLVHRAAGPPAAITVRQAPLPAPVPPSCGAAPQGGASWVATAAGPPPDQSSSGPRE